MLYSVVAIAQLSADTIIAELDDTRWAILI